MESTLFTTIQSFVHSSWGFREKEDGERKLAKAEREEKVQEHRERGRQSATMEDSELNTSMYT